MGRQIQSSIRINGHEVLCMLSGRDGFYNMTQLWQASKFARDNRLSPLAYQIDGRGKSTLRAAAEAVGCHPGQLMYFRHDTACWWGSHPIAMDYCAWLSPEFRLVVIEAARRWAEQALASAEEFDRARAEGKIDRRYQTDAIRRLGIKPPPGMKDGVQFGIITNCTYQPFLGMKAAEFKALHGIGKNRSVRDFLDPATLSAIGTSERVAADKCLADEVHDLETAKVLHHRSSELISEAIRQFNSETTPGRRAIR